MKSQQPIPTFLARTWFKQKNFCDQVHTYVYDEDHILVQEVVEDPISKQVKTIAPISFMNRAGEDRRTALIQLLIDQYALDADRDDAAMELGEEFYDESVLSALIQVADNPNEIDMILNSCGEAIGKIWVKRNCFDEKIYRKLPKFAQDGIYCVIKSSQPGWIEKFHIDSI